jgi:hypothetical protein
MGLLNRRMPDLIFLLRSGESGSTALKLIAPKMERFSSNNQQSTIKIDRSRWQNFVLFRCVDVVFQQVTQHDNI